MSSEPRTRRILAAAAVAGLAALTGCATVAPGTNPSASASATSDPPASTPPAPVAVGVPAQLDVPDTLSCGIARNVPRSVIDERRPLSTLSAAWQEWIASESLVDDADGWFVLHETEDELAVVKQETPRDDSPSASVGFLGYLVGRGGAGAGGDEHALAIQAATTCVFNLPLTFPLATAYFVPKAGGDPAATSITLLVEYMACQPGPTPVTALQVTALRETQDTIEIAVAAEGDWWLEGTTDQATTCVLYPPTEFTVQLAAPVGDRRIIDTGVYPAVEVPVPEAAPGS